MFQLQPRKRPSDAERRALRGYRYRDTRFLYGDEPVDIVTARFAIYLPAYLYNLHYLVPDAVLREILFASTAGRRVLFFDWDGNFDVEDPDQPFSHSAILASWFGGTLPALYLSRGSRHIARSLGSGHASLRLLSDAGLAFEARSRMLSSLR